MDGRMSGNKTVKTVSMIMLATACSKILGFVRHQFLTASYGAGAALFMTPLRISQDFFELFLGAAILGVFIPVYNSFENNTEKEEFANIFLNVVILVTGFIAVTVIILSRQIIGFTAFDAGAKNIMADLLQILFPMIILMGAVYTFIGILQSKGEFFAPAIVSAISNCAIILYFIFFDKYFGLTGLSIVYLFSWVIQLFTLVMPLFRKKYKYRFIINFKNPALAKSVKMALPIIAGAWLVPVVMMSGIYFTSLVENDEFYNTAFNIAMLLFLLVTGILTHGVCNYIFPKFAQNANNEQEFARILKSGFSGLAFIIAPVACIAFVLRGEAFAVLFMRGEFTPELTSATADMFAALAPAMIMFSVIELLNRVFYAKNYVRFPMIAALSGIIINLILCYIFINILELSAVYITVAVLICQSVAAVILIIVLKLKIRGIFNKNFSANLAKIVLSSGIMLIIINILYSVIENNAFESGLFQNIVTALIIFTAGAIVYMGANFILRTNETRVIIKILKKD